MSLVTIQTSVIVPCNEHGIHIKLHSMVPICSKQNN